MASETIEMKNLAQGSPLLENEEQPKVVIYYNE
jgi:hypothetical protein